MTSAEQGPSPRITLYTKADCDLCQQAKDTLLALRRELAFDLDVVDITTDPALYDAFHAEIPVGYLDGRKLFKYHVDRTHIRRQLQRKSGWGMRHWFARV